PEIHEKQRVHTGINTVTSLLEKIIHNNNDALMSGEKWTVFVCKRDIQPTQLCNHFITMCSLANVKLVPLPEGAQLKLSGALALTRVAVVAFKMEEEEEERLRLAVDEVQNNYPEWLDRLDHDGATLYRPTNVKILQTTAP
ncbi:hypothetical protein BDB00DRAFT_739544, partial [Zychaea mexicana]|uniref:uncharacterized protein n=1 Tax=Zychaea mexicana TaxID=64656 RepID=UPI0022FED820